jgi:hypothetical protein
MERIDRIGSEARRPRPRDCAGFVLETDEPAVSDDGPQDRTGPRREGRNADLSPEVIRRWLACLGFAVLGLGLLTEPGAGMEPQAAAAVVLQS